MISLEDFVRKKPDTKELKKGNPGVCHIFDGEFKDPAEVHELRKGTVAGWELDQGRDPNPMYWRFPEGDFTSESKGHDEITVIDGKLKIGYNDSENGSRRIIEQTAERYGRIVIPKSGAFSLNSDGPVIYLHESKSLSDLRHEPVIMKEGYEIRETHVAAIGNRLSDICSMINIWCDGGIKFSEIEMDPANGNKYCSGIGVYSNTPYEIELEHVECPLPMSGGDVHHAVVIVPEGHKDKISSEITRLFKGFEKELYKRMENPVPEPAR